ncbi:YHS domain-containing protein [Alicyclobacillus mengziensis]|uniref:YHS domain-containing protein n=1 Tax=Alicyclobacillus mengziensis TaxID=2931921 RepID=A0A9X7Z8X4_9BACL|nr:YHS domain-containing protein [Alicyclobacillus mengziensis]QSO48721.1 YHS domain-containing protein [Alicyclobacillus mengziensis]
MTIDPVCGMDVSEETAPKAEYQGITYYFCCEGCRKAFTNDPQKYINTESASHHHGHHHAHHHGDHY